MSGWLLFVFQLQEFFLKVLFNNRFNIPLQITVLSWLHFPMSINAGWENGIVQIVAYIDDVLLQSSL